MLNFYKYTIKALIILFLIFSNQAFSQKASVNKDAKKNEICGKSLEWYEDNPGLKGEYVRILDYCKDYAKDKSPEGFISNPILSDFGAINGVNTRPRDSIHQGIDIIGSSNEAVIAIADGKVVPDSFEENRFLDADIIEIIKQCEVDVLDEFSSATPDQRNCRITATTEEGEKITAHRIVTLEEIKKGMPKKQVIEKFRENTVRFYAPKHQDNIVNTVMDIDNNSNLKSFSDIFKFDQT